MKTPTYFDLFQAVLPVVYRADFTAEQWGTAARELAEQLIPFAGITVAASDGDPGAPAPVPEVVAEVVQTSAKHPFGPAFEGWDVPALRMILAGAQELALAQVHGATPDHVAPLEARLLAQVKELGIKWTERTSKKG